MKYLFVPKHKVSEIIDHIQFSIDTLNKYDDSIIKRIIPLLKLHQREVKALELYILQPPNIRTSKLTQTPKESAKNG